MGKSLIDLTEFDPASHPLFLKDFLAGEDETYDAHFFVIMKFSGNGFTFEIRRADKFDEKSDDVNRLKIKLPNSENIRTRPNNDIETKSIKKLKKNLHYIKGLINDLRHRNNNIYVKAIGTAALRDTSNAQVIQDMITAEIGKQIEFEIVEGDIEAALSAHAITLFYPKANGVVVDMGGGSTEFALLKNGEAKDTTSLSMGTGSIGSEEDPESFVKETMKSLPKKYKKIDTLFLSGGTFRNINKAICEDQLWDIKAEQPSEISLVDYKEFIKQLIKLDDLAWRDMPENLQNRREFLEQALEVVKRLEKTFPKNSKVALTKTKTRDGLFRFMYDLLVDPESNPEASVNKAFSNIGRSLLSENSSEETADLVVE